ncbi:ArsR/SmtB family transcription factor [Leucobacter musarum]|uniref:ArsR/SmtB family transcription factor n=1 Tax=Leucobacter musarum TaxID=1930747 RepID=UPI0006A7F1F4|nr:metalloregulator ArsR/SmtB family transcription factor [Leucobacter musarum]
MNADKKVCGLNPSSEFVDLAAEVLGLLADPTRIRIILALRGADELPVNALAEAVGKKPSGVSQHLARLRMARMVTTRQEGTSVYYRLTDEHALALVTEAIKQAEHAVSNGQLPPHHHAPQGEAIPHTEDGRA